MTVNELHDLTSKLAERQNAALQVFLLQLEAADVLITRLLDLVNAAPDDWRSAVLAAIRAFYVECRRRPVSDADVEAFIKDCVRQFGGRPVWERGGGEKS